MFKITIFANVDRYRTEAEIYDDEKNLVAIVFEDDRRWQTLITPETRYSISELEGSIADARRTVSRYVNRRGLNVPPGLTRSGVALWLMVKDDGAAMGQPVGEFPNRT